MAKEIESFEVFSDTAKMYGIRDVKSLFKKPSVFNGLVRVKRFKITVEEIEESDEVIINRLKSIRNKEIKSKNCYWHVITAIDKYCRKEFGDDAVKKIQEEGNNGKKI